jgi:hypothetical protein
MVLFWMILCVGDISLKFQTFEIINKYASAPY